MIGTIDDIQQEISEWIDGLKNADPEAAQHIWYQYFEKLVRLARQRLAGLPRRIADEEDVALSALNSVILGIQSQKFPELDDRHDLWKLLVVVTNRKAIAQQRRHFAAKRPDWKMNERMQESSSLSDAAVATGREPDPEFAAQFAEEVQRLLMALPSEDFRRLALLRMDGYTNREIAEKLNWYEVKVERRLRIIRKQWAIDWEVANGIDTQP